MEHRRPLGARTVPHRRPLVVYYAAGRRGQDGIEGYATQRSGTLRSKTDDPLGEWEDMGMLYTGDNYQPGIKPTIENTEYAIDLTTFELKGQRYAVWSGNEKTNSIQQIRIAKMSNPYTISSSLVEISTPTQSWETMDGRQINEGPAVLINEAKGKLFIVYSCNPSWTKNYRLAWLMLDMNSGDPMSPGDWQKSSNYVFWRATTQKTRYRASTDWATAPSPSRPTEPRTGSSITPCAIPTAVGANATPSSRNSRGTPTEPPTSGPGAGWGESLLLPSGETL